MLNPNSLMAAYAKRIIQGPPAAETCTPAALCGWSQCDILLNHPKARAETGPSTVTHGEQLLIEYATHISMQGGICHTDAVRPTSF